MRQRKKKGKWRQRFTFIYFFLHVTSQLLKFDWPKLTYKIVGRKHFSIRQLCVASEGNPSFNCRSHYGLI
jgi:hypothetical protein